MPNYFQFSLFRIILIAPFFIALLGPINFFGAKLFVDVIICILVFFAIIQANNYKIVNARVILLVTGIFIYFIVESISIFYGGKVDIKAYLSTIFALITILALIQTYNVVSDSYVYKCS